MTRGDSNSNINNFRRGSKQQQRKMGDRASIDAEFEILNLFQGIIEFFFYFVTNNSLPSGHEMRKNYHLQNSLKKIFRDKTVGENGGKERIFGLASWPHHHQQFKISSRY